ncbi:hypothetical protein CFP71_30090 [Amycolatopsis thailandensis]|uniref:Uncharacterized protein n=1 Tax=Amycolatopsis thailandensis TaxID=589330 RepID=A0A229RRT5_9PSEU|nr:hypothetical protein [Amycolatopsis thailandensis]OXM49356.1 hypothetical protein CFP71_30090 [Amycolatopsis thailandensis]
MDTDSEFHAAVRRAEKTLLRIPGVHAVGGGAKRAGGVNQGFLAIQVYVDRKLPFAEVAPDERVPSTMEGYPTNVVAMTNRRYAVLPQPAPGEPLGKREPPPDVDMQLADEVLAGGGPITGRIDDQSRGSIGLLMEDVAAPGKKIYALTCFHSLCKLAGIESKQEVIEAPVREKTVVGQVDPNGDCSSSHCCNDGYGEFWQGDFVPHSWRDIALVRLRPGTKYFGGIKDHLPIKGIAPNPTEAQYRDDSYLVRKYGNRTGKTGGRIVDFVRNPAAGQVVQFIVVPHIPPGTPPDAVYFGIPGDSGAAVVTPDVRAMGIVTGVAEFEAKEFFPETPGKVNGTLVAPLNAIMIQLRDNVTPKYNVTPVLATSPADIRTVPANLTALFDGEEVPVRMPSAAAVASQDTPPRPTEIGVRVRDDLSASPFGRELVVFWERHGAELVNLVNHDRQVIATWHRSGASAVYQHLGRLPDVDAGARLPVTVNDEPLADCVTRMHAVLARRGSDGLRAALDDLVPRLPELAGLSYPRILATFDATRV